MGPVLVAAALSVAPRAFEEIHGLFANSNTLSNISTCPANNRKIAQDLCKKPD
jgi:hypothetical protein